MTAAVIVVVCLLCLAAYVGLCVQARHRDQAAHPRPMPPGGIPTQRPKPTSGVRP